MVLDHLHLTVQAGDLEEVIGFYKQLGFAAAEKPEGMVSSSRWLAFGGVVAHISAVQARREPEWPSHFAFHFPTADQWLAQLDVCRRLGMWIGPASFYTRRRRFLTRDPWEHLLEFSCPCAPGDEDIPLPDPTVPGR